MNFSRTGKRRRVPAVPCGAALLLAAIACHAQTIPVAPFDIAGFGTLGAIYHDGRDLEFRRTVSQSSAARANQVDFGTDSVLGLQAQWPIATNFRLTAQGIADLRANGDWAPRLSRVFARYSFDESAIVRAGRIGTDIYLLADTPAVGYSFLPVRPPGEFFGIIPTDELDGGDVTVRWRAGAALLEARGFGGRLTGETATPTGRALPLNGHVAALRVDYMRDPWTARVLVGSIVVQSPEMGDLVGALRVVGSPQSLALSNVFSDRWAKVLTAQLSIAREDEHLRLQLHLARYHSDSILGPQSYVGSTIAGYRYGRFTPYTSFSFTHSTADMLPSGLPDGAQFAALNAAVREVQSGAQSTQHTVAFGVRYDFARRADLKLQVERVNLATSSLIIDHRVPAREGASLNAVSLAFDFLF